MQYKFAQDYNEHVRYRTVYIYKRPRSRCLFFTGTGCFPAPNDDKRRSRARPVLCVRILAYKINNEKKKKIPVTGRRFSNRTGVLPVLSIPCCYFVMTSTIKCTRVIITPAFWYPVRHARDDVRSEKKKNKPKRRADGRERTSPMYYFYCWSHRRTAERSSCLVRSLFRSVVRAGGSSESSRRLRLSGACIFVFLTSRNVCRSGVTYNEIAGNMIIWILFRVHPPRGGPRRRPLDDGGVFFSLSLGVPQERLSKNSVFPSCCSFGYHRPVCIVFTYFSISCVSEKTIVFKYAPYTRRCN